MNSKELREAERALAMMKKKHQDTDHPMNPTDKPINLDAVLPDFESQEIARLTAEREQFAEAAKKLWGTLANLHDAAKLGECKNDAEGYECLAQREAWQVLEEHKALAAYASAKEHDGASGWRPIETASKEDGKDILFGWQIGQSFSMSIVHWDDHFKEWQTEDDSTLDKKPATHWQPLPPAPKTP